MNERRGKEREREREKESCSGWLRQQMKQNMKETIPRTYKIYMPINFLMIQKIFDIIIPFKMP